MNALRIDARVGLRKVFAINQSSYLFAQIDRASYLPLALMAILTIRFSMDHSTWRDLRTLLNAS